MKMKRNFNPLTNSMEQKPEKNIFALFSFRKSFSFEKKTKNNGKVLVSYDIH